MTKFEATNREFLSLYKGLESVKTMKGAKFAVLVGKNLKALKGLLDPLEQAALPSIEFQELSLKMQELIKEEDQESIEALEAENTELIEERKKQLKDVEDLLDNTTEVELYPINEDQLPEDINAEQVENLLQIIE